MAIVFVGIDLAKNVFAVRGVDEAGKPALLRPAVPRGKLHELIATLPPCTVAMETCSGSHHGARLFAAHGHGVRLIAPKFVVPCHRLPSWSHRCSAYWSQQQVGRTGVPRGYAGVEFEGFCGADFVAEAICLGAR
jgi:hypothetical protein